MSGLILLAIRHFTNTQLKFVGNDVQKVIRHYQILSRYVDQNQLSSQGTTSSAEARSKSSLSQALTDIVAKIFFR